jgi:putative tryptophan/tyrosine transport system substrate-binding protein
VRVRSRLIEIALCAFLFALGVSAEAQQAKKLHRIGYLYAGSAASRLQSPVANGFERGLSELGYIEGRNVVIEWRDADFKPDKYASLAGELARLKVDIIVAAGPASIRAAKNATGTIPIVAVDLESDPVATGLVESLARPAGNVTGLFLDLPELSGKQLELLKEVIPRLSRVVVLWDPATGPFQLRATEVAAQSLGVQLQPLEVPSPNEFDSAFRAATKGYAEALVVLGSPVLAQPRIAHLATKSRLPLISQFKEIAEAGGLIAYGPSRLDMGAGAATFVSKILNGAKPAELPVERPIKFELVINLTTAKQIGLTIPPSVLARADKVIK